MLQKPGTDSYLTDKLSNNNSVSIPVDMEPRASCGLVFGSEATSTPRTSHEGAAKWVIVSRLGDIVWRAEERMMGKGAQATPYSVDSPRAKEKPRGPVKWTVELHSKMATTRWAEGRVSLRPCGSAAPDTRVLMSWCRRAGKGAEHLITGDCMS